MEECETKESQQYSVVDSNTNDELEDSGTLEYTDDICFKEETLSNSDNLEVESGVESATGDVTEAELLELGFTSDYFDYSGDNLSYLQLGDLDLTTEQAQETLKYFSEYNISSYFKFILRLETVLFTIVRNSRRIDQDLLNEFSIIIRGLCTSNVPYLQ